MSQKKVSNPEEKATHAIVFSSQPMLIKNLATSTKTEGEETTIVQIPYSVNIMERSFSMEGKSQSFLFKDCHHPDYDIQVLETMLYATKLAKEILTQNS